MKVVFNPLAAEFQLVSDQASEIRIADPRKHYQSKNVEDALQELAWWVNFHITDAPKDGSQYARQNGAWTTITAGGGTWGSITGTLADQIDLNTALSARVLKAGDTMTGKLTVSLPLVTSGDLLDLKYDTAAYATAASFTPTGTSNGWVGFTIRQLVNTAQISSTGYVKIRLTFEASATSAISLGAVYIGHAASSGDVYDFETTPTQVTFSGNAGFSDVAGSVTVSDDIWFTVEAGKNLVIAFWANGTSGYASKASVTGWSTYYKIGNDTTTVNATGYTGPYGVNAISVKLVEAGNPTPTSAFVFGSSGLTIQRPVTINGATSLTNILSVTKGVSFASTLGVTGATTLASTLGVAGITTPTNQVFIDLVSDVIGLRVQGHSTQTSHIQTWETSAAGQLMYVGGKGKLVQNITYTETSGVDYGIFSTVYANSASSSSIGLRAGSFDVATTIANAQNYTSGNGLVGIIGRATHQGTGTVAALYGLNFILNNTSTGTVTGGTAIFLGLWGTAGSTYTTIIGMDINTSSLLNTVGTAIGISIGDMTQGGTANYAIYTRAGDVLFNAGGHTLGDFTWKTDSYNGIFGDASNNSIVIMSNAAGKVGMFGATAIVQPTTAIAAATFAANTSGIVNDTATFDGYTIGQVVKALRNLGVLA